jgi:hydroxymethylpyrimidine/phosphomethylpyrimidine kinase
VTALTVQSSQAVESCTSVSSDLVAAQLRAVLREHHIVGAKVGMLGNAATPAAIAEVWNETSSGVPLVVDPVLVSSSGSLLLEAAGLKSLRTDLLPLATVITPNLPEAASLLGWSEVEPGAEEAAARALQDLGSDCVVLTGGHGLYEQIVDTVVLPSGELVELRGPRIETSNTHGTGCLLSAGILSALTTGAGVLKAIEHGRACVQRGLLAGREGAVWLDRVPEGWNSASPR